MTKTSDPERLNFSLPPDVAKTLREVIPPRKRTWFVAQAIEREQRLIQAGDLSISAFTRVEVLRGMRADEQERTVAPLDSFHL